MGLKKTETNYKNKKKHLREKNRKWYFTDVFSLNQRSQVSYKHGKQKISLKPQKRKTHKNKYFSTSLKESNEGEKSLGGGGGLNLAHRKKIPVVIYAFRKFLRISQYRLGIDFPKN